MSGGVSEGIKRNDVSDGAFGWFVGRLQQRVPESWNVNIQLHLNIFITFKALDDLAPAKHKDPCTEAVFYI